MLAPKEINPHIRLTSIKQKRTIAIIPRIKPKSNSYILVGIFYRNFVLKIYFLAISNHQASASISMSFFPNSWAFLVFNLPTETTSHFEAFSFPKSRHSFSKNIPAKISASLVILASRLFSLKNS